MVQQERQFPCKIDDGPVQTPQQRQGGCLETVLDDEDEPPDLDSPDFQVGFSKITDSVAAEQVKGVDSDQQPIQCDPDKSDDELGQGLDDKAEELFDFEDPCYYESESNAEECEDYQSPSLSGLLTDAVCCWASDNKWWDKTCPEPSFLHRTSGFFSAIWQAVRKYHVLHNLRERNIEIIIRENIKLIEWVRKRELYKLSKKDKKRKHRNKKDGQKSTVSSSTPNLECTKDVPADENSSPKNGRLKQKLYYCDCCGAVELYKSRKRRVIFADRVGLPLTETFFY